MVEPMASDIKKVSVGHTWEDVRDRINLISMDERWDLLEAFCLKYPNEKVSLHNIIIDGDKIKFLEECGKLHA